MPVANSRRARADSLSSSATLLQSSTATYQSGLASSYWYAVGGTIQIAFFA